MSAAKLLVDGIRLDCPSHLTLAKYRDVIARLIFGAPFSSMMAAEAAGNLSPPFVDLARASVLASEHGPWIHQLVQVAERHLPRRGFAHLTGLDLHEIIAIAAERDRVRPPIETWDSLLDVQPGSPAAANIELTRRLRGRLGELSSPALIELMALAWLGRGDHDEYPSLLAMAQQQFGRHDVGYLAAKGPLHTYLQAGLQRLGAASSGPAAG